MKIHGTAKGGAVGKKDFGVAFGGGGSTPAGTIDGEGLRAYYKFNESSGNVINHADQVTNNDTNDADLVVNNGGDADHIVYEGTTDTPDNLPDVIRWNSTSTTDGGYADANGAASLWNFLKYGDGDANIAFTVCFWGKFSALTNNTMLMTTTNNSRSSPWIGWNLKFYASKFYSQINVGDAGGTGNESVVYANNFSNVLADGSFHFYSLTYDQTLGSANYKIKRDNDNLLTKNKTAISPVSANTTEPLAFGHQMAGSETFIPPDYSIASLSLWSRVLTDDEITEMYADGDGMQLCN